MSTKYFRRDVRDRNHKEITAFLRQHGYEVIETERPVDILIYDPSGEKGGWAEIKVPGSNGKIKRSQIRFMADTQMPVQFVTCEGEALIFASDFKGLDQRQKNALHGLLRRNPDKKTFQPNEVREAIK